MIYDIYKFKNLVIQDKFRNKERVFRVYVIQPLILKYMYVSHVTIPVKNY